MSVQARDVLMLAISLATTACSACLYVLAVLYRARGAFSLTSRSTGNSSGASICPASSLWWGAARTCAPMGPRRFNVCQWRAVRLAPPLVSPAERAMRVLVTDFRETLSKTLGE